MGVTGTVQAVLPIQSVGATASPLHNRMMVYLLDNVDVDPVTGCWRWTGTINHNGYGAVNPRDLWQGVCKGAHRASKIVLQGWEPSGPNEQIRHQCARRECINPWHSLTGSALDNLNDRRRMSGAGFKLDAADVWDIRTMVAHGIPQNVVARRYGVDRSLICRIVSRQVWAHVA